MFDSVNTMRIRKWMVAIISVILILVTTIGYIALTDVYAVGEEEKTDKQTEESAEEADKTQDASDSKTDDSEKSGNKTESSKDSKKSEDSKDTGNTEDTQKTASEAITYSASSYIVMSGSTSEKVIEKHAERKMQPGKITMLMTAMVALDNMYDDSELNNTVETGSAIAEYGDTFKKGESASVGDLMKAMLVGGDVQAAELIAKYSASSREIFVNEMNSKCMELGLMDTFFTNASGRYDIKMYSTASDLAVITQAAMRYQLVKDTLLLKSVKITAYKKKTPREIEINSTDPLLTGDENTAYSYIKGGILGTTGDSANNTQFAAVATKDDMQLIVILMDSHTKRAAVEAKALLEQGDKDVTKNTIVKRNKLSGYARVRNGDVTRVAGYTETKGFAYVPPEGSDSLIQTQVVMLDDLEAPLKKGDKIGEFRIYVADELKGTVDLITKRNVEVGWYLSRYYISNKATVAVCVILLLLLLFMLRVMHVKRRRAKRREAMRRAKIRELAMKQLEIDADRKARDWNGAGYETMPLRTTDLRRAALEEEETQDGHDHNRKR